MTIRHHRLRNIAMLIAAMFFIALGAFAVQAHTPPATTHFQTCLGHYKQCQNQTSSNPDALPCCDPYTCTGTSQPWYNECLNVQ